jgi:hypothetical protein
VTNGMFFIAFFTFYDFESVKNMFKAKKTFKIFGMKPILSFLYKVDLNGSVGSISDLKPKGPGFESRIRQGYICWLRGSKRSGCVMNDSPCGFEVKEFALKFPKNMITKNHNNMQYLYCGRKMR